MGAISWDSIYGSLGSFGGAWSFSIVIALGAAWRFGAFCFYNLVFLLLFLFLRATTWFVGTSPI